MTIEKSNSSNGCFLPTTESSTQDFSYQYWLKHYYNQAPQDTSCIFVDPPKHHIPFDKNEPLPLPITGILLAGILTIHFIVRKIA